jgi:hypothetical protein
MKRLVMAVYLAIIGMGGVGLGLGPRTHVALAGKPTSGLLGLTYSDPTGDQRGRIDVTGLSMSWDAKGNYTITLTADSAHPFTGQFSVTVNLYDANQPVGMYDNSAKNFTDFFSFACKVCKSTYTKQDPNDFNLGTGTATSLTITGSNSILQNWQAGDQVAISGWTPLGDPYGSGFRSSVAGFPVTFLTNEDMIGVVDAQCDPYQPVNTACPLQAGSTATIVSM